MQNFDIFVIQAQHFAQSLSAYQRYFIDKESSCEVMSTLNVSRFPRWQVVVVLNIYVQIFVDLFYLSDVGDYSYIIKYQHCVELANVIIGLNISANNFL